MERLSYVTGLHLITEMLEGLRAGKECSIGKFILTDLGLYFETQGRLSSDDRVWCKWTNLVMRNGAGYFYISKINEKRFLVELPYLGIDNAHILETAIRTLCQKKSVRLSELLYDAI